MLTATQSYPRSSTVASYGPSPVLLAKRRTGPTHQGLKPTEIRQLERQGCEAEQWARVHVAADCDLTRLRHVTFAGDVWVGRFRGEQQLPGGIRLRTGIYQARLQDCRVGNDVLIHSVRQGIANYDIEHDAVICDVASLTVAGLTSFGNGQVVSVLREDGALPLPIFDGLSSNIAWLLTTARDGSSLRAELLRLIEDYVSDVRASRGRIGAHAVILGCGTLSQVQVGPAARVLGATRISNCSLNSVPDSPVEIGDAVVLSDSVISSGSNIDNGAKVSRCFVGQGVRMGQQFSASDSLFFANAEAFQGEACAVWAGPFSVTHHKSTLLIASQTSFFNAGSATNQSNHAYKTGPVHYGILERGCKSGSSSCMYWPAHVGAFTTIVGRHRSGSDTSDFPFSYLVESQGQSRLIPALNLLRVGLWRDVRKWGVRDRRSPAGRLDLIHHQALSPWTVQRMLRGRDLLGQLAHECCSASGYVRFAGVSLKREDIVRGQDTYARAIRYYLAERVVELLEKQPWDEVLQSLRNAADGQTAAAGPGWSDAGGYFVSGPRLTQLVSDVGEGRVPTAQALQAALLKTWQQFPEDQTAWALQTWLAETGKTAANLTVDDLAQAVRDWREQAAFFHHAVLEDCREDVDTAEMWDRDHRVLGELAAGSDSGAKDFSQHPLAAQLQAEFSAVETRAQALLQVLQDTADAA